MFGYFVTWPRSAFVTKAVAHDSNGTSYRLPNFIRRLVEEAWVRLKWGQPKDGSA